jgi:TetR/AcrR family transcriptional regulator, transcriptional repressor for nem operon
MKVDQKTMAAHRAAMLTQASKLFRQRGIESVPVAEIASAAGLTHGAFYGHFSSKTALAAESCRYSLERGADNWRKIAAVAERKGEDPIAAVVDHYLSPTARDSRESSCALASLGHEASRTPDLNAGMAAGIDALAQVLRELIARRRPKDPPSAHANAALAALAAMSGGLSLARLLVGEPERSDDALKAAATLAKQAANQGI